MVSWDIKRQEYRIDRFVVEVARRTEKRGYRAVGPWKRLRLSCVGFVVRVPGTAELVFRVFVTGVRGLQ